MRQFLGVRRTLTGARWRERCLVTRELPAEALAHRRHVSQSLALLGCITLLTCLMMAAYAAPPDHGGPTGHAIAVRVGGPGGPHPVGGPHHGPEHDAPQSSFADRGGRPEMSSTEAARIARRQAGGRVLNVILEQGPAGPYYLVKILEQGRIRTVHVDARR